MSIPEVDIAAFAGHHAGGATVIDVREPDEYAAGHVPGAVLIPLGEVPERVAEVPEGETVYLICRSGARSMRAGDVLAAEGRDVVNVGGGTMAWIEAGHATVVGDSPT